MNTRWFPAILFALALWLVFGSLADASDAVNSDLSSGIEVIISEQGLDPDSVYVTEGTQITWYNQSGQTIRISSEPLPDEISPPSLFLPQVSSENNAIESAQVNLPTETVWTSDPIPVGSSYARIFSETGRIEYFTSHMPGVAGVITVQPELSDTEIVLRSRAFIPAAGVDSTLLEALKGTDGLHAYAQLTRLPTPAEREKLEDAGVQLASFVGGTLYEAFVVSNLDSTDPTFVEFIRWLGPIPAEDKIDPKIIQGKFETWADLGPKVKLIISFHGDVSAADAQGVLAELNLVFTEYGQNAYATEVPKTKIQAVAERDEVTWVEEGPMPILPTNDIARSELMVDPVQSADIGVNPAVYAGLDGTGVNVAVFDTFQDSLFLLHNDFAGRLLRNAIDNNGHGTHVAGIIGGSGVESVANCPSSYASCLPYQLRGMAPNVGLALYSTKPSNDTWNDAINALGVDISNHSYVQTCGAYGSASQTIDELVRGDLVDRDLVFKTTAIPSISAIWAAANQGEGAQYCNELWLPDGPDPDSDPDPDPASGPRGYYSVFSPSKNSLTVGSLDPSSGYGLSKFSSRGPTWDGRLKPDLVAIGCMMSTDNTSQGYVEKCGTSMASPAVAGIAALLIEQYRNSFPSIDRPIPSTLKAILVQTATDLVHEPSQAGFVEYGWNDPDTGQPVIYHAGPDWATGYGVVNAEKAVAAIRAGDFITGTVSPVNRIDSYKIQVAMGSPELKLTLAWDDEAGNPKQGVTEPQLVNDLDINLEGPNGQIIRPWVLAPLPRANVLTDGSRDPIVRTTDIVAASRGRDSLNNVEQVQVSNPTPGEWTVYVHAANLPNGNSQVYSLAGIEASAYMQLTVAKNGDGTGTVTSDPAGINCGSDCSELYTQGTSVTLTATPDEGSAFAGWSGACSGSESICEVAITQTKQITASFVTDPVLVCEGGNGRSMYPSISEGGRFVAFHSSASNLVSNDMTGRDVFVHDRLLGDTTRVSIWSEAPSISDDGRFVAFRSEANYLVEDDTWIHNDVFVHDRQTGGIELVSVRSDGTQGAGESYTPSISGNGRYVCFPAYASLVISDTNKKTDIFVHDRQTGETTRVSISSDGEQGNESSDGRSISYDGRYVSYRSFADNLVPNDTNLHPDVFVHDRQTGETTRVSVSSEGNQSNHESYPPNISGNGRFVSFSSSASNLVPDDTAGEVDVFVHDLLTGETTRVSVSSNGVQGSDRSSSASISSDGRYVSFESDAVNLVNGDTNGERDVFVHDRQTGETTRVSISSGGIEANGTSWNGSISEDGRYVSFISLASNLVEGDTNDNWDVFVHDQQTGETTQVSVSCVE